MRSEPSENNISADTLADKTICVVSPCRMQNELMASFLQQRTEAKCLAVEDVQDIQVLDDEDNESAKVVLFDCLGKDPESILAKIHSFGERLLSRHLVLFFNVSHGLRIEEEAVIRGVRGFFYTNDSFDQLERGIRSVLRGELWISREILSKLVLTDRSARGLFKIREPILTRRETEILSLVASGATNAEIAIELYISTHTVKSHLYNVYKKIKVTSRLEAAIWANKNL